MKVGTFCILLLLFVTGNIFVVEENAKTSFDSHLKPKINTLGYNWIFDVTPYKSDATKVIRLFYYPATQEVLVSIYDNTRTVKLLVLDGKTGVLKKVFNISDMIAQEYNLTIGEVAPPSFMMHFYQSEMIMFIHIEEGTLYPQDLFIVRYNRNLRIQPIITNFSGMVSLPYKANNKVIVETSFQVNSSTTQKDLYVYNLETGELKKVLSIHNESLSSTSYVCESYYFSDTHEYLIFTEYWSSKTYILDLTTKNLTLIGDGRTYQSVAIVDYDGDGKTKIGVSQRGNITVYEVTEGTIHTEKILFIDILYPEVRAGTESAFIYPFRNISGASGFLLGYIYQNISDSNYYYTSYLIYYPQKQVNKTENISSTSSIQPLTSNSIGEWFIVNLGDFNDDGVTDYVAQESSGVHYAFTSTVRNWLTFFLSGEKKEKIFIPKTSETILCLPIVFGDANQDDKLEMFFSNDYRKVYSLTLNFSSYGDVSSTYFSSLSENSQDDYDGDGLTNQQENSLGTNPYNSDSDNDGLTDGKEIQLGTNPLSPDTDKDGLRDNIEIAIGTNPNNPDTDGDGISDGAELIYGTNPLIRDNPTIPTYSVSETGGELTLLAFFIGVIPIFVGLILLGGKRRNKIYRLKT